MDKPGLDAVIARKAALVGLLTEVDSKRSALLSEDEDLAVAERALNRLEHLFYGGDRRDVGFAESSGAASRSPIQIISVPTEVSPETVRGGAIGVLQRLSVQTLEAGRDGLVAVRAIVENRRRRPKYDS